MYSPRASAFPVPPLLVIIPGMETGSRAQVVYITNDKIMHVVVADFMW